MEYDVTIKSHYKDYKKLKYVVNSIKYLNPLPENIYIITDDGFVPNSNFTDIIIPIKDLEVTPFIDKQKFKYRKNWCWVNSVSISQNFTKNDLYLDIQADNFFINNINLFEDNKIKLFKTNHNPNNNNRWSPYFDFSKEMFGIDKITYGSSYITEFIMYDKNKLKKLWEQYESFDLALDKMYNIIGSNCYPADQEIYGNLVEKFYSKELCIENINVLYAGGYENISSHYLQKYITDSKNNNPNHVACSYHTYWME